MHQRGSPLGDSIAKVQLDRLAASILSKSSRELAEIANDNPAIYLEWISEIRRRDAEVRAEARKMSMALQSLLEAPKRSGQNWAA